VVASDWTRAVRSVTSGTRSTVCVDRSTVNVDRATTRFSGPGHGLDIGWVGSPGPDTWLAARRPHRKSRLLLGYGAPGLVYGGRAGFSL
jgi:hypothetical protein